MIDVNAAVMPAQPIERRMKRLRPRTYGLLPEMTLNLELGMVTPALPLQRLTTSLHGFSTSHIGLNRLGPPIIRQIYGLDPKAMLNTKSRLWKGGR